MLHTSQTGAGGFVAIRPAAPETTYTARYQVLLNTASQPYINCCGVRSYWTPLPYRAYCAGVRPSYTASRSFLPSPSHSTRSLPLLFSLATHKSTATFQARLGHLPGYHPTYNARSHTLLHTHILVLHSLLSSRLCWASLSPSLSSQDQAMSDRPPPPTSPLYEPCYPSSHTVPSPFPT